MDIKTIARKNKMILKTTIKDLSAFLFSWGDFKASSNKIIL
jgi:hypothetical protein